jgi:hypothetical protein
LFSTLQASTQRKQPMQRVESTPKAQRCLVQSYSGTGPAAGNSGFAVAADDAAAARFCSETVPTPEQTAVVAHILPSKEMKPRRPAGSVIDFAHLFAFISSRDKTHTLESYLQEMPE